MASSGCVDAVSVTTPGCFCDNRQSTVIDEIALAPVNKLIDTTFGLGLATQDPRRLYIPETISYSSILERKAGDHLLPFVVIANACPLGITGYKPLLYRSFVATFNSFVDTFNSLSLPFNRFQTTFHSSVKASFEIFTAKALQDFISVDTTPYSSSVEHIELSAKLQSRSSFYPFRFTNSRQKSFGFNTLKRPT